MKNQRNQMMKPEEELVDVLLDFIIVAANLTKKINRAMKGKRSKEGGEDDGKV